MKDKFCVYCGAKIPDGAKFCPKCGSAVIIEDHARDQDFFKHTTDKKSDFHTDETQPGGDFKHDRRRDDYADRSRTQTNNKNVQSIDVNMKRSDMNVIDRYATMPTGQYVFLWLFIVALLSALISGFLIFVLLGFVLDQPRKNGEAWRNAHYTGWWG
ncbi:hypothetical protein IWT140_00079 [Secundilactobacillus pentosiphilus]|uniref:Zinc-ribbon domain-containing protein n=1 Tax=Secundilactobacillus pentosiphilus TaxID=1714682 RepID=A0A1Z5ILM5_9LACO|nr:zinc ribbon domain-containing protein [Secundilactobacillus pentosiphilus]GAX02482.1 hypothetical protein IWT140_00079 [Secundilactobacillus pentosiphilus]